MAKKPVEQLTHPKLTAYHVLPDSPLMQRDFLLALASLEALSQHPLAADVVRIAQINGILPVSVIGFQEFPNRGLGGLVYLSHEQRPRAVVFGSRGFIAECGLQLPDLLEATARKWENEADSVIAIGGWDGWVRGVVQWKMSGRHSRESGPSKLRAGPSDCSLADGNPSPC